jgi:hypothetical protein
LWAIGFETTGTQVSGSIHLLGLGESNMSPSPGEEGGSAGQEEEVGGGYGREGGLSHEGLLTGGKGETKQCCLIPPASPTYSRLHSCPLPMLARAACGSGGLGMEPAGLQTWVFTSLGEMCLMVLTPPSGAAGSSATSYLSCHLSGCMLHAHMCKMGY